MQIWIIWIIWMVNEEENSNDIAEKRKTCEISNCKGNNVKLAIASQETIPNGPARPS